MKTTTRRSEHAQCAAAIRRDLKTAFPTVTFRVRSDSFSNGNAVDVKWVDGPTTEHVARLIGKYQEGHFDGSIDLYDYSNRRDDLPQAKYVQTQRSFSPASYAATVAYVNRRYGWALQLGAYPCTIEPTSDGPRGNCSGWKSEEIWRTFSPLSLLCTACHVGTLPGDAYCPACGAKLAVSNA